jgi:hypothetical protein
VSITKEAHAKPDLRPGVRHAAKRQSDSGKQKTLSENVTVTAAVHTAFQPMRLPASWLYQAVSLAAPALKAIIL